MELRQWLAGGWLPVLLIVLAVFGYLSFAQDLFNDGDTSWHLATGRWIVDHWTVPRADPFSYTFRGASWTAHEWLSEAIMAIFYGAGSWAGLGLLFAGAVSLTLLCVGLELKRWMAPRYAVAAVAALVIMLNPSILARPHVLAWPLIAIWTLVLIRARERKEAPPLAAALMMLGWANLHGSFVFGLLLGGVFGLEALIEERDKRRVLLGWGSFGAASLLLTLSNPSGLQGLLFPFQVSTMTTLPLIQEWRPSTLSGDPMFFTVTGLALVLLLLRRPRISIPRLLLLVVLFWLALSHARHQSLFGIVGALLIGPPLAAPVAKERKALGPARWSVTGALAVALALLAVIRFAVPVPRSDGPTWPMTALAHVPPALRTQPVINGYALGGPLILNGIAPFIDGRADMYGDAFVAFAHRINRGDVAAFAGAVKKWNVRWTILGPGEGLVKVLDKDPAWRRLYADKFAVIHVRR